MTKATLWMIITFATIMIVHWFFDMAKWAIGRYTEASIGESIAAMIVFSLMLSALVEVLHRLRRRGEQKYMKYTHWGRDVWVKSCQKGKHWEPAICCDCIHFNPDTSFNCPTSYEVFKLCVRLHLVAVVWECPLFEPKEGL